MTTTSRREPNVAFRAQGLRPELTRRGRPGIVARRDLQRYYEMLAEGLAEVALTLQEAYAIARASEPLVRAAVDRGALPGHRYLVPALAERFGYGDALVEKVRAFDRVQIRAIVDALEQRLVALDAGAVDSDQLLTEVGLVRP